MEEDKQAICDALTQALQLTRAYFGISHIDYEKDLGLELVRVYWNDGHVRTINVHWDSGAAMIRDILRGIV